MSGKAYIERIVRLTRPSAKFVTVEHSNEFTESLPFFKDGYYYVSLYDEKIDSVLNTTKHGVYLVHNTYLSSFAYNLFLCLLYQQNQGKYLSLKEEKTVELLCYNFKKFFAEQLLHFHENIFSRAIFLETLLYEEEKMVPVFEAKAAHPELNLQAEIATSIMSGLVSFHELGHYFLNHSEQTWPELLKEYGDTLKIFFTDVESKYHEGFVTEFKCDAIAVYSCLSQFKEQTDPAFILNAVVFGFSSFAVMWSLVKSAHATGNVHKKLKEEVDFSSIEKTHRNYDYQMGRDEVFIERAKLVIQLCQTIAKQKKIELFDFNASFSLLNDMLELLDKVMESSDPHARSMAMLVAESLHDHPKGMEYLYLRSKVFTSQRELGVE